jgi:Protein of unknown function (DUF1559)
VLSSTGGRFYCAAVVLVRSVEAMSFRLWTIFYVFALVAAAMATFGPLGLVAAGAVTTFWIAIYSKNGPKTITQWIIVVTVLLILLALVLPPVETARESARQDQCMNNLRNLTLALIAHESRHGTLPPAFVADNQRTPMLSWRALLLQRIERQDGMALSRI